VSWRFARTPKWIIRHVLVVALVVTMISLGFWQLRRLDEKQDYKALVDARQEEPAVDVSELLTGADVDAVLYRSVRATGTYEPDDTVVVENRTLNGAPGGWVLTPLRLDDGATVVVNRGFIGFDREGAIVPPAPPGGLVTVEGLLFPSQRRGSFGPTDRCEQGGAVLARVDLACYAEQLGIDLLPAYVQLVTSDPAEPPAAEGAPTLVALGPPEPSEGPHLAYAVQWFIFSAIAAGGYLLLLRKVAGSVTEVAPQLVDGET
jgi:surfeit locus 1 family protein